MKYIFIPFFICISYCILAQDTTRLKNAKPAPAAFPQHFIGHWKGEMNWYPNGRTAQKVAVQLIIQPVKDSTNQYTWQIIYGEKQEDNRPYILKQADTLANHWVVDEKNGIVLDSYWLGDRFTGAFTVQGNTILDSYWLQGNELHFEFFSYPQKAMKTTGNNTEDSPAVEVYRINSYQKGVMKRIASARKQ